MLETPREEDRPTTHNKSSHIALGGKMSPGVKRMEALAKHFTCFDRFLLLSSTFLVAYSYSLNFTLGFVYKVFARQFYAIIVFCLY
jgi:hypothetical protein